MPDARVKKDLRLSPSAAAAIDKVCQELGISQNSFYILASCQYAVKLAPMIDQKRKRQHVLKNLSKDFQKVLDEASKV